MANSGASSSKALPTAPRILNINVGVLGHVDSGKTSLGEIFDHNVTRLSQDYDIISSPNDETQMRHISALAGIVEDSVISIAICCAVAALSTRLSTAALDKHPQSKERGITLDLGFSSFSVSSINSSCPRYHHLCYGKE
jgi:selenocysteine-specific elongation factor